MSLNLPDLEQLHYSREEDEELFFCQGLAKASSFAKSKSNDPLIVDESAVGINEPVWMENFRIYKMIWVIQWMPKT